MEPWEYRDNEKVLGKFKVKLNMTNRDPEEADCLVTNQHLMIEVDEPIKLPFSRICSCRVQYSIPSSLYGTPSSSSRQPAETPSGSAMLTYLSQLNEKCKLSLNMSTGDVFSFRELVESQIEVQGVPDFLKRVVMKLGNTFLGKLLRDETRDRICAMFVSMGIDACIAERGRAEEITASGRSLGLIDIDNSLINLVNVRKEWEWAGDSTRTYYFTEYGIRDQRLGPNSSRIIIRTVRVKSIPLVGRPVDLRWEGEDLDLGIIDRLNEDMAIKQYLMTSKDIVITANGRNEHWKIMAEFDKFSRQLWNCYEDIAKHLLAKWPTDK